MRILFVDDEPMLLEAMRRLLRAKRPGWQVACARCGEHGLAELDAAAFDVVVTDMRMPGIDGASLLGQVRDRQPHAVRIVLSGFADEESSLRAAGVAHQCVSKPCSITSLEEAIQQADALRRVLRDPTLRGALGAADALPPAPAIYHELAELLDQPMRSVDAVAKAVSQDATVCTELLHGIIRSLAETGDPAGLSLVGYERHVLDVAHLARRIAPEGLGDMAFFAGLVHDAGKLVLATRLPAPFAADCALADAERAPIHLIEQREHGYTHAEVGAYLFSRWELPGAVVEAVAHHHSPRATGAAGRFDLAGVVHLADALLREAGDGGLGASRLDLAYVKEVGLADRLAAWRSDLIGLAG